MLAKNAMGQHPSEDDALALMIILHTHQIRLREPILQDRPGVVDLAAITQRHAAEVMATIWPDRSDKLRTYPDYWYSTFNTRTPYEVVEDVLLDWMIRLQRVREHFAENPLVQGLEPED
jgi:hypothetical protein